MNKKELHKFNNRFNSFALAFEQLKKAQHRNSIDKSITIHPLMWCMKGQKGNGTPILLLGRICKENFPIKSFDLEIICSANFLEKASLKIVLLR